MTREEIEREVNEARKQLKGNCALACDEALVQLWEENENLRGLLDEYFNLKKWGANIPQNDFIDLGGPEAWEALENRMEEFKK